ncbi:MAG: valine--tRNA ligase, partial [Anaerolineae bacterium]
GFDDNGLPTERLVERTTGITAAAVGREAFIERCLQVSADMERDYEALWRRLGLSMDWRYSYRTIDALARRTSQWSFIDLHRLGLVYRRSAPAIWCPECGTAIAQAELADLERASQFYTLAFRTEEGDVVPIATTRPELLSACVAVFVHPDNERTRNLVGRRLIVPLYGQKVPVRTDPRADPSKGTGVVMCCTFGDATDVEWWLTYNLPLVEVLSREGRMTTAAGDLEGLTVAQARRRVVERLEGAGLLLGQRPTDQSVRVHERCDTPVEHIVLPQWFVRVLDHKQELLEAGERIAWHPEHMRTRYSQWVENLSWDWCISRQRYFGVPFPLWYCADCGEVLLADESQLPVDPMVARPLHPCACGSDRVLPETDVMDTWATSSLTPQIVGQSLANPALYERVFPMSLRPQAHEIIRTWAFYTIVKSLYHFGRLPWAEVAISGWALAPEGMGKISKSRGGGPMAPQVMVERYSADATRYWAASTGLGRDAVISEEKVQTGAKLVTKLWNVARFCEPFLVGYTPAATTLAVTDRWLLSRLQRLILAVTVQMAGYDYAAAKAEVEAFFWNLLADNYIEMAKQRLYAEEGPARDSARFALYQALLTVLKLFAPFLPHVTEEIHREMFLATSTDASIHCGGWPCANDSLVDEAAEATGEALLAIATAVRRYKSERNLPLRTELARLQVATTDAALAASLRDATADIVSVTRAQSVLVGADMDAEGAEVAEEGQVRVAVGSE